MSKLIIAERKKRCENEYEFSPAKNFRGETTILMFKKIVTLSRLIFILAERSPPCFIINEEEECSALI